MIKIFNRAVLIVGALYRKMTDLTLAGSTATFTGGPIGKLHITGLTVAASATLDIELPYAEAVDGDILFAQCYGANVTVVQTEVDYADKELKFKLLNLTASEIADFTVDIQYHIIKRK